MNYLAGMFAQHDFLDELIMLMVFVFMASGFFLLFTSASLVSSAKDGLSHIYSSLHTADEKRVLELEKERRKYGTLNADGKQGAISRFLLNLDDMIIYSGLGEKIRFLNTTTYLVMSILAFVLIQLVLELIGIGIIASSGIALGITLIPSTVMGIMRDRNHRLTEEQLVFLIDSVSNNSTDASDMIMIFERCAEYAVEPVRSIIYRAISKARVTGSQADFVEMLTREVEHPIFVRFIRALEMASQKDADYRRVALDYKDQAEVEIAALNKRRAIFKDGRNELLLLAVMGLLITPLMCNLVEMSLMDVIRTLPDSMFGMFVSIAYIVVFGGIAVYLSNGSRK